MPRLTLCRLPSKLHRRARRHRMATLLVLLVGLPLLLLFPLYCIYRPPALLIHYLQSRWPDVLFEVQNLPPQTAYSDQSRLIALTIDDAPSPYTQTIVRLLTEHNAHATFFVIGGQVAGREDALSDVVATGNELGNHAMHDEPSRELSEVELEAQINDVHKKIQKVYDTTRKQVSTVPAEPPKYFRPGSGFFSDRMRALASRLGYRIVLGSVYPHDAQVSRWRVNAAHILSMVRPGAIIICHDRRSWTIPMLEKVLPELKRRGYKIVTVTELLRVSNTWH